MLQNVMWFLLLVSVFTVATSIVWWKPLNKRLRAKYDEAQVVCERGMDFQTATQAFKRRDAAQMYLVMPYFLMLASLGMIAFFAFSFFWRGSFYGLVYIP